VRVIRSIVLKFIAMALLLLMQGPAVLVQELAWGGMLYSYTQERGLKRGVIETFDGKHPCKMCKAAESLRQQRDDPEEAPAPQNVRPSLVWGPMMIPPGRTTLAAPIGRKLPAVRTGWLNHLAGRGADIPDTPPPELG